jgi:transposase
MIRFKSNNQNQLALFPLNLEDLIAGNHLVRIVNSFVNEISIETLLKSFSKEGQPPFEPRTMLKIIIYSYSIKLYSSRKIERALKQDVTYMWLSGMQTPDHNTINRFRSNYFRDILEEVFTQMLDYLFGKGYIKYENYFTDGTKIETNANKYSHVWAKNTNRYKEQVRAKVKTLFKEIEELNNTEDQQYISEEKLKSLKEENINSEDLKKAVSELNVELAIKTGIKKRSVKSKINQLEKSAEKIEKYEDQEKKLNGRNSYSKTDTDATFMRMKNDALEAAYNVQLSSENQFVTNFSVSQNASDTATFPEHFEKIVERGEKYIPQNNVADAAYGSEENYTLLEKYGVGNYLKYNSFFQDTKGGNKNPFHKDHFKYNQEKDFYVCPKGSELHFVKEENKKTDRGFETTVKNYQATNCQHCEFKDKCSKGANRTVQRSENLENFKTEAYENLTSEKGKKLRMQRNIDIEPIFGDIKENAGYRRFRLRTKEKVEAEVTYLSISHNIRKIFNINLKTLKKTA